MKIILLQDVEKLGQQGDVISVKDGYARNFLIPRKLAWAASAPNMRRLNHEKKVWDVKNIKEKEKAVALKGKLEALRVTIAARAGEENLLYGSITAQQIAEALERKGILLDRRKVHLDEPIKRIGTHDVKVHLHRDVEAVVRVEVVAAASEG
jgi:large subunit ribosomal protein L9